MMPKRSVAWRAAGAALSVVLLAAPAHAQIEPIPQDRGANGLALALRRIGVTPRVLYVTAHPDDEHNGMLVRLSRGLGVRTGLLTLTRGDGGQNAIGPELFDALAVLRTEELAALHRYDAVEQYFGQSVDFGYSFSVEESLDKWGRQAALGDVVRIIRSFRPEVVITLPLEAKGGGHHHQAAAHLAREAFRVAADPAQYAELGLPPWQARKVYQGGVGGGAIAAAGAVPVSVRTGIYDPLLGLTWQQFGSVARGMHRSQSTGQMMAAAGEGTASFILLDSVPPVAGAESGVLDGLDLTFGAILHYAPGHEKAAPFLRGDLAALQAGADAARAVFDAAAPEKAIPALSTLLAGIQALQGRLVGAHFDPAIATELKARLADEESDAAAALSLAHGVALQATGDDDVVVPGQQMTVTARVVNLGKETLSGVSVSLITTPGWGFRVVEGERHDVAPGNATAYRFAVWVPAAARPSAPYWRRNPGADRFELLDPALAGRPWAPPPLTAVVRYRSGTAVAMVTEPVHWRYESAVGEKQKAIAVGADFSVRIQPDVTVIPVGAPAPREFRVAVRNQRKGAGTGRVRLQVPAGWTVQPAEAELRFRSEGEEVPARFTVTPGAIAAGENSVRAVFVDAAGAEFTAGEQVIAYEHIHERRLVRPAAARVIALDVATTPGTSVGYVDGVGDEVDTAIRQLGIPLTYLTADDLAFGDLARFTTIVTGIRAYEARPDLRSFHHRLMDYVDKGGNLVVQYNRLDFNQAPAVPAGAAPAAPVDSPFAPYPASVTSNRVTDETTPPRLIGDESPLLTRPNVLGPADWQGWVQERGLNFLSARDPRYENVVAFVDPFPLNAGEKPGALVDAPVGHGRWTYVGLGLFRQLPAGVPGAYRLLANLVGRPRAR